jgi:hypothetical protein
MFSFEMKYAKSEKAMTVSRVGTPQRITDKSWKASSIVLAKAKKPRLIDLPIKVNKILSHTEASQEKCKEKEALEKRSLC